MALPANKKPYKPNAVPPSERVVNLLLGSLLSLYGVAGLLTSRVDLQGQRLRIAVLEGRPAWLMASAFIVGAAVLFSVVIDHYDTSDNERYYRAFRWAATRLGWCLVAAALGSHLYLGFVR